MVFIITIGTQTVKISRVLWYGVFVITSSTQTVKIYTSRSQCRHLKHNFLLDLDSAIIGKSGEYGWKAPRMLGEAMNAAAGGAKAIEGMPPAEGKSVL